MTSNLQNLSLHSEDDGQDDVTIGDDKGLSITHIGSTSLSSSTRSKSFLYPMFCMFLK